jgi:transketolase
VEEHYVPGGLGSAVCTVLCTQKKPAPVKMLGIPRAYAGNGPYKELLSYYHLDPAGIAVSIAEFAG